MFGHFFGIFWTLCLYMLDTFLEHVWDMFGHILASEVGGSETFGSPPNREIVSCRACVRARGLVVRWDSDRKTCLLPFPFPFLPRFFLFFAPRALPFSLLPRLPFPFPFLLCLPFAPPPNLLSNFSWPYGYYLIKFAWRPFHFCMFFCSKTRETYFFAAFSGPNMLKYAKHGEKQNSQKWLE